MYSQNFAGGPETIQDFVEFHVAQLLRCRHGLLLFKRPRVGFQPPHAILALQTKIGTGWVWSDNPVENNSSTSHTNLKFSRLGYHNVCTSEWQGYSQWVIKTLLQVRCSEASSNGSTSLMVCCSPSFSSLVGNSVGNAQLAFFFWNSLTLPSLNFINFSPTTSYNSPSDLFGTAQTIFDNNSYDVSDILANLTHFGTEKN